MNDGKVYPAAGEEPPPTYASLNFEEDELGELFPENGGEDYQMEGERQILKIPSAPFLDIYETTTTLTYDPAKLTSEDIYSACMEYVQNTCCYGSKFVQQMELTDIDNGGAFHYTVETFGEMRESTTFAMPYSGQPIDGPENGPPPEPWEIPAQATSLFRNEQVRLEVPHTAYVRVCDRCVGNGRIRCSKCSGIGRTRCMCFHHGGGRGRGRGRHCAFCHNTGRRKCMKCHGTGQVKCKMCGGYGNIKMFTMLIVTWTNHMDEFVSDVSSMPDNLVKSATGSEILSQENRMVPPIDNAPDESVNMASRRLIESHRISFPNELILRQRQVLRVVPFTKATYRWKDKTGDFYVYGQERKVYFEDYPQKCFCCTCL